MPMLAHSLLLLDASSPLRDALNSLFTTLFQVPVTIAALVLAFVCAILGWLIAYIFLRPKDVCSMVCSIHFLLTVATILLGMLGAIGLIDHYFPGQLITGTGVSLLVLTIPLFILAESFNYVVLSNKHARQHRDLRTAQDKQLRRVIVFLTPLTVGAILLVVGIIVSSVATVTTVTQVVILLLALWILALGAELIFLARSRQRNSRLAAMTNPSREEVAALWVSGFSSYRIGRGETVFTSSTMSVQEQEDAWGNFTQRVVITEELLLEEEGELDLVEVEEQETVSSYAAAGAGGAALALHGGHRSQRHQAQNRFRRRWGGVILLLIIAVVAVAVTVIAGGVSTATTAGIALAFLAPVVFLIIHRMRRDNDVRFASAAAERVTVMQSQFAAVSAQSSAAAVAAPPPAPRTRGASGAQTPGAALHPARPVPVNPPMAEPLILPQEEPEPPTLPSAETAAAAGEAHENPDIADDTIIVAGRAGAAHENPDIAEDTLLIAHKPVSEVSDKISITEFQHYLRGIHYPATRAQLLEQARKNNAPPNMIARLEVLEESYTFTSVSEVMRGYAYHRYLRGVRYPATRDELIAHARANNAPARMIIWLESLEVTMVFASLVEVMRAHTRHLQEKGEEDTEAAALMESAPAAPEPAPAPAAPEPAAPAGRRATRSIRITDFQHYLHGVDYPATREQLLEQARKNNAPPNMIVRLEELDPNHQFVNARDVMVGYANHRFLSGVSYPATSDQLLEYARANNVKGKLVAWLEGLSEPVTFTSLTEVVRSYEAHHDEDEDEDE
jgi:hypothetical protein